MIIYLSTLYADNDDNGGCIALTGGAANEGDVGSLDIASGKSNYGPTGNILVHTADSGK